MKPILVGVTLVALGATPVLGHEFWISPQDYEVPANGNLVADIRVGQNMTGSAYAYVPQNFDRFEVINGDTLTDVPGRAGDRPALDMAAPAEGLAVIVHETRDYDLTYTEWEKFENFAEHKDFTWALEEHDARGLPRESFKEVYSRYGKALIAVGNGAGADRSMGLLTEIVAATNPYTDDLSGGFVVQVLYDGTPRSDVQIELFEKPPGGEATTTLHRTDTNGRAVLPVKRGHEYLVDSVVLRPVDPVAEGEPVWESLWASLTFMVPE